MNSSSKSISEISEETNIDRTVIPKYLKTLQECGILIEEKKGSGKFYTVVPNFREDTYFGLPLDKEIEKNAYSLYFLIKKYSNKLNNTNTKEIAYEVIKKHKELNIPYGRYIDGGVDILAYDKSKNYQNSGLNINVENTVKEITQQYSKTDDTWKTKKLLSENENNSLYSIKEELLFLLYSPNFDLEPKKLLHIFLKKLNILLSLAPKVYSENYNEILNSYRDLIFDIRNKLEDEVIKNYKREIILLSEALWEYIALFNFKNDLKNFYSPIILDIHFKMDISQQEEKIINLGTKLQSLIPEDEIVDPFKKDFYEKLYSGKPISPEQLKEQKNKLDKLKKEMGDENFIEFLRKEFGLN